MQAPQKPSTIKAPIAPTSDTLGGTSLNMNVVLREYEPSDLEALENLFLTCQRQTFILRPPEVFDIGDFQNSTIGEVVWVALVNDELAGFFSLSMPDFIHNLFLLRKFQKMGIGTALLAKAESLLSSPMELRVAMDNERVGYFYERNGWLKISSHPDALEPYIIYKKWKMI